jgi:hypothetical protein
VPWLESAAAAIHVVLDQIERSTLDAAGRLIDQADVLCFLGFAFAKPNFKRLGLPDRLSNRSVLLFGTTTGERDGFRERVTDYFRQAPSSVALHITLGPTSSNCCDLLHDYYVLRG